MRILALLLVPSVAHAGHSYTETPQDKTEDAALIEADKQPQWEVGVAFDIGSFHTGPTYNLAYGFDLACGVRLNRLGLYGTYSLLGLGSGTPDYYTASNNTSALVVGGEAPEQHPTGLVQRLGLDARYSFGHFIAASAGAGLIGDLWVEAGLGEQMIRWNEGGALHRTDVSFGFGMQMGGRGPAHHGGYYLGVRATIAGSPPAANSNATTCAGPCDTATPPLELDKSILFTTGFVFGS
jgi:hypothetical protein